MGADEALSRYLLFELGGEACAVGVERVEEVLESAKVTRVPRGPAWLLGLLSHRGSVIPVADLAVGLGAAPRATPQALGPLVLLHLRHGGEEQLAAIPVDAVRGVAELDRSRIEAPPRLAGSSAEALVTGVYPRDGGCILVLDIDEAFPAVAPRGGR